MCNITAFSKYLGSWDASDEAQTIKADTLPIVVKLPPELSSEGEVLLKRMWHLAKSITDEEFEIQREALKQAEIGNQARVEEALQFSEAQSIKIDRLEYSISDLQAKLAEEQQSHSQAVVHLKEGEKK